MTILFASANAAAPRVEARARRAIRRVLKRYGPLERGELNVVWTTRESLRRMNRRFRKTGRFTDVIAFRHGGESSAGVFPVGPADPFGDLFIAVDQARANARRFGISHDEELVRLAVHGTLHLLGYTDYDPRSKARMWAAQEPIVRAAMGGATETSR